MKIFRKINSNSPWKNKEIQFFFNNNLNYFNNIFLKKTIESFIKAKRSLIHIKEKISLAFNVIFIKLSQDCRSLLFRYDFTLDKIFSIYFFGNDKDKTKKLADQNLTEKSINITRIR